jgi:hypothetical protein
LEVALPFHTLSTGTPILVSSGNVLVETTFGEFLETTKLDDEEVTRLREKLQKGLSYDGVRRDGKGFLVMRRR